MDGSNNEIDISDSLPRPVSHLLCSSVGLNRLKTEPPTYPVYIHLPPLGSNGPLVGLEQWVSMDPWVWMDPWFQRFDPCCQGRRPLGLGSGPWGS